MTKASDLDIARVTELLGRKPQGDFELLQVAHAYEQAAQSLIQKRPPGV